MKTKIQYTTAERRKTFFNVDIIWCIEKTARVSVVQIDDLLLLWVHSRLLIWVGASRGRSLSRILITIGIMPANSMPRQFDHEKYTHL